MTESLFTTFAKENRQLSSHLARERGRQALDILAGMSREELTDERVRALAEAQRVAPPVVIGRERAASRDDAGARRYLPDGTRVPTAQHWVAFQLEGEPDLLRWWPDVAGSDLEPVDVWTGPGDPNVPLDPQQPFNFELAPQVAGHHERHDRWQLRLRADDGPLALFTRVELTREEERDVHEGRRDLRAEVDDRFATIAPIIDAVGVQVSHYFDVELPQVLAEAARRRIEELDARESVRSSLVWPTGWKQSSLEVEAATTAEEHAAERVPHADVALPPPGRLADASFEDVLRTIRVWADAVERYPDAYTALPEDRLSDLLAATLNAALPGAQREVYHRAGKSDILVRGSVIADGSGPEVVFICESKWWGGPKALDEALVQVEGYLQVRDTAAVLVVFFGNPQHAKSARDAAAHLRGHAAQVRERTSPVDGWALFDFNLSSRNVRLCLATIEIPPTRRDGPSVPDSASSEAAMASPSGDPTPS